MGHDQGDDRLTAAGVLTWVRPPPRISTPCSFDRVLDVVVVSGVARPWRAAAEILEAPADDCPDDPARRAQRPRLARVEPGSEGQPSPREQ
jgi:hypothetical protein